MEVAVLIVARFLGTAASCVKLDYIIFITGTPSSLHKVQYEVGWLLAVTAMVGAAIIACGLGCRHAGINGKSQLMDSIVMRCEE